MLKYYKRRYYATHWFLIAMTFLVMVGLTAAAVTGNFKSPIAFYWVFMGVCFLLFVLGIKNCFTGINPLLKECCEKNQVTMEQLEEDFACAEKITSRLYVGKRFLFGAGDSGEPYIYLKDRITGLEFHRVKRTRGSNYYVYIFDQNNDYERVYCVKKDYETLCIKLSMDAGNPVIENE